MYGIHGRILRVNLSNGNIESEELTSEEFLNFIGGRGIGIKKIWEIQPKCDPLSEENMLIFSVGPLSGTPAQIYSRWMVTTKSPLTGTIMKSCGGGEFGDSLKKTGYDAIIIKGCSSSPVILNVNENNVSILNAKELWGLNTSDTQSGLKNIVGKYNSCACIGPAGEMLVKMAAIVSGTRTAARGGVGAVMGSKKLKAITVSGSRKTKIAKPDNFYSIVKEMNAKIKGDPAKISFSNAGTAGADYMNNLGVFPVKNFTEGQLDNYSRLRTEDYLGIKIKDVGCNGCMVRCGNVSKVKSGKFAGWECEGPDYETIWAFTGPSNTPNIGLTVAANKICDELGLDTISVGNSIGFLTELVAEKGIKIEDKIKLNWGVYDDHLKLIEMIAYRKGIGDLLGQGVRAMGEKFGFENIAIHSKGLELTGYDPRAAKSQGLSYATSNIGAHHTIGYASQEIYGNPDPYKVEPLTYEKKSELTRYNQDQTAIIETGVGCIFFISFGWATVDIYAKYLGPLTGIDILGNSSYLWLVGERIYNLERLFNMREGFGYESDNLPERIINEPLKKGIAEGETFELQRLLTEYYAQRGWDRNIGGPTKTTIKRLGLESFVLNAR